MVQSISLTGCAGWSSRAGQGLKSGVFLIVRAGTLPNPALSVHSPTTEFSRSIQRTIAMQLRAQVSPALRGLQQVLPLASLLSTTVFVPQLVLWQITSTPSFLIQQNLLVESENLLNLLPQTRVEGPPLKVQPLSTSCPDRKFRCVRF